MIYQAVLQTKCTSPLMTAHNCDITGIFSTSLYILHGFHSLAFCFSRSVYSVFFGHGVSWSPQLESQVRGHRECVPLLIPPLPL